MLSALKEKTVLAAAYYASLGSATPLRDACRFTGISKRVLMKDKEAMEALDPVIKDLESVQSKIMERLEDCLSDDVRMENVSAKDMATTLSIVNKELRLFKDKPTEKIEHTGVQIYIPQEED